MAVDRILPSGTDASAIARAGSALPGATDAELHHRLAGNARMIGPGSRHDEVVDFVAPAIETLSRSTGRNFDTDFVTGMLAMIDGPVLDRTEAHPGLEFDVACIVPIHVHVAAGRRVHVFTHDAERAAHCHEAAREYFDLAGIRSAYVEPWHRVDLMEPVSEERRRRYAADVVYGSYDTLVMDSLRMAPVTDGHFVDDRCVAFVEEIDTVLIKSGDSDIRITGPATSNPDRYAALARWVRTLDEGADYTIDEELVRARLTPRALDALWDYFGITERSSPVDRMDLAVDAELSVRAHECFEVGIDYYVVEGHIVPIAEGALPTGSAYEAGLHQALAAREGLVVEERQRILEVANVRAHIRKYATVRGGCRSTVSYGAVLEAVFGLDVVDLRAPEFRGVDAQYVEVMDRVAVHGRRELQRWDVLAESEKRYRTARAAVSPDGGSPSDIVGLLETTVRGLERTHRVLRHSATVDSLARRYAERYAGEQTPWRVACAEVFRTELDLAWSDHIDLAMRMRESFPESSLDEFGSHSTASFEINLSEAVIRAFDRIFAIRL
ncbi:hypothetical protein ACIBSV_09540 [Embleya sp. NPDC050154]|uniref:preprotein translocase subunit SecA n=1 Tax=Embleya sp. NPDC050154 TaxID=3363988 RepID=UPI0037BAFEFA